MPYNWMYTICTCGMLVYTFTTRTFWLLDVNIVLPKQISEIPASIESLILRLRNADSGSLLTVAAYKFLRSFYTVAIASCDLYHSKGWEVSSLSILLSIQETNNFSRSRGCQLPLSGALFTFPSSGKGNLYPPAPFQCWSMMFYVNKTAGPLGKLYHWYFCYCRFSISLVSTSVFPRHTSCSLTHWE